MSIGIEGRIQCPFYMAISQRTICCEGAFRGNHKTTHLFNTYADKVRHLEEFCCVNGGKKCPHYRLVASLYEVDNGAE
jgi:hypothetical protein